MKNELSWQDRLGKVMAGPAGVVPPSGGWRRFVRFQDGGEPVEGAIGAIWVEGGLVHALAVMIDSEVFSSATGRRARTWETGDVMEFFIHPDPAEAHYFEYHIAPSGAALSLRIADAVKLRADTYTFESLIYESIGFVFHHGTFVSGWWGHVQVPVEEIGLRDSFKARACLCRYNYNKAWPRPELSTTAQMTGCSSFHTPERWHPLGD